MDSDDDGGQSSRRTTTPDRVGGHCRLGLRTGSGFGCRDLGQQVSEGHILQDGDVRSMRESGTIIVDLCPLHAFAQMGFGYEYGRAL